LFQIIEGAQDEEVRLDPAVVGAKLGAATSIPIVWRLASTHPREPVEM
jgi:hypothetical protein